MDLSEKSIFGDPNSQPVSESPLPLSSLEKQLVDIAIHSLHLDPLAGNLEIIKLLRTKVTAVLKLQIAELTQTCRHHEEMCEKYVKTQRESKIIEDMLLGGIHRDENKQEELDEAGKNESNNKYEEHKRKVNELKEQIRMKELQTEAIGASFEKMADVRSKEKEFLILTESLKEETLLNSKQQLENAILLKRIEELHVQNREAECKLRQLESDYRNLLEENITLKATIEDQENHRVEKDKQDEESKEKFFKHMDQVLDVQMSLADNKIVSLLEENRIISAESELSRAKIQDQEKQISSMYAMEKEYQEKTHNLLVEIHLLVAEMDNLETKYRRLENEHKKLAGKYQNTKLKLHEAMSTKETSEKDYSEKISNLLKSMDQFKEAAVGRAESKLKRLEEENQKLTEENHDLREKMFDITIRDIMGIKPETGGPGGCLG